MPNALLSWDKLKNKLAMKKLGVLLLVSSIEYFNYLLVKNYAGKGFEKSLLLSFKTDQISIKKFGNTKIFHFDYLFCSFTWNFTRQIWHGLVDN